MSRKVRPIIKKPEVESTSAQIVQLTSAFNQIFAHNASSLRFEELYRYGYNIVLDKQGKSLYNNTKNVFISHVAAQLQKDWISYLGTQFLEHLLAFWDDYCLCSGMIRDVLLYMEKTLIPERKMLGVTNMAYSVFRENGIENGNLGSKLFNILIEWIEMERVNECVCDCTVVQRCISLIKVLNFYEDFQVFFLERLLEYFTARRDGWLEWGVEKYWEQCIEILEIESERMKRYFDGARAVESLENCLLRDNLDYNIQRISSDLLDDPRFVKMFFKICSRIGEHEIVRSKLKEHAKAKCLEQSQQNANEWMVQVLSLILKMDELITSCLDKTFEAPINSGLGLAIAEKKDCALFVCQYIDQNITQEDVLERALSVFKLLPDKDIFEKHYKRLLAKRLLRLKTAAFEKELWIIGKLKLECGSQFTLKLEGMVNDIRISQENLKEKDKVHVTVLTTAYWPFSHPLTAILPTDLEKECLAFETKYLALHSGRRLVWHFQLGYAQIQYFLGKKYEIQVATPQMLILLLFNANNSLTLSRIAELLGMSSEEILKHLHTLTFYKFPILIMTNESVSLNLNFSSKLLRFKIPLQPYKAENDPSLNHVESDRRHQIEATIVRVMKSAKRMDHSNLMAQVSSMLMQRFTPNPVDIKKRIEALIEREYLRRIERNLYEYVA